MILCRHVLAAFPLLLCALGALASTDIQYSVADRPWPEGLGSQRAVISIPAAAPAVRIQLFWRRHDAHVDQRRLLLVHAVNGDTISHIRRIRVDREVCDIVAGPVVHPGEYYLYYLSYDVVPGWGYYSGDYLPREFPAPQAWLKEGVAKKEVQREAQNAAIPKARILGIQARTAFDSFFPMEVIPTTEEKEAFLRRHGDDCLLFPEGRRFPIRMRDEIPLKWTQQGPDSEYTCSASRNEYMTFQIGVFPPARQLEHVTVSFSDLRDARGNTVPAERMTCFNTEGIDAWGIPFSKPVDIPKGSVQALWMGIDIPPAAVPGQYTGSATVTPSNAKPKTISIRLRICDSLLADRGDSEPWRHSRLRWLNSTLGLDSNAVAPYAPIIKHGSNSYELSGRSMRVGPDGLPEHIAVRGTEILAHPIRFIAETSAGTLHGTEAEPTAERNTGGMIFRSATLRKGDLTLDVSATLEADGFLLYRYRLSCSRDISISDVRLEIPFQPAIASHMMGMGRMGSAVPQRHYAVWEGSHDSFWIGDHRGGLYCELRGAEYTGPLLDLFKPGHPRSWWNDRKGGFSIRKDSSHALATVFSGARPLAAQTIIEFSFALLITPVKQLNMQRHFTDRYYHGGGLLPTADEVRAGIRVVNLHHANAANPYLNYPFLATPTLRRFVDSAHTSGLKLKLYYTIRELTNHVTELWALRSLGNEILADGPGGGFPWLREHCVTGYTPQWYQHFDDDSLGVDAALLTSTGPSRWYNYYVEGLAWLLRETGIDGLYLDDVAFDRHTLKRMRKVMEAERPGCLIDLHSNTFFSKGPATQYAEFFPYIDRLWFGEGFQYNRMPPENWLVEVSGIPFGLTGDMLEGGGNPWRGMAYGMTVRYPWQTANVTCDPRAIWKVWDSFGIANSVMSGYWEEHPAVTTDHPDVLATTYIRPGRALLAVASWAHDPAAVHLEIDWKRIGLDKRSAVIRAEAIEHFQSTLTLAPEDALVVEPGKGWLLVVETR